MFQIRLIKIYVQSAEQIGFQNDNKTRSKDVGKLFYSLYYWMSRYIRSRISIKSKQIQRVLWKMAIKQEVLKEVREKGDYYFANGIILEKTVDLTLAKKQKQEKNFIRLLKESVRKKGINYSGEQLHWRIDKLAEVELGIK